MVNTITKQGTCEYDIVKQTEKHSINVGLEQVS